MSLLWLLKYLKKNKIQQNHPNWNKVHVNLLADVHCLAGLCLWVDVQDTDREDAVTKRWSECEIHARNKGFGRQKLNVLLPAAWVLVEMSAGKALVTAPSSQNLPSFLSAADLDPGKPLYNKKQKGFYVLCKGIGLWEIQTDLLYKCKYKCNINFILVSESALPFT